MRSPAEIERKKDRIRIRQEDRIDDREFYGDADIELNEDLAFAEEEALLEGKHDTAMNSIRNVRSSGPTQTGVIQLRMVLLIRNTLWTFPIWRKILMLMML